jgi:hypothetical protein
MENLLRIENAMGEYSDEYISDCLENMPKLFETESRRVEAESEENVPLSTVMTWGDLMRTFFKRFPGLQINDMRPNDTNQMYVWLKNDHSVLVTYRPETDTFLIEETKEPWTLLDNFKRRK